MTAAVQPQETSPSPLQYDLVAEQCAAEAATERLITPGRAIDAICMANESVWGGLNSQDRLQTPDEPIHEYHERLALQLDRPAYVRAARVSANAFLSGTPDAPYASQLTSHARRLVESWLDAFYTEREPLPDPLPLHLGHLYQTYATARRQAEEAAYAETHAWLTTLQEDAAHHHLSYETYTDPLRILDELSDIPLDGLPSYGVTDITLYIFQRVFNYMVWQAAGYDKPPIVLSPLECQALERYCSAWEALAQAEALSYM